MINAIKRMFCYPRLIPASRWVHPFVIRDNEDGTYSLWLHAEGDDLFEIPNLVRHPKVEETN